MRVWFVGLGMLFSAVAHAAAYSAVPDTLDIRAALSLALAQHPQLEALRAQKQVLSGRKLQAYGIESPELYFFREGIGSGQHFAEQRWTLVQRFDFPLTIYYRVQTVVREQQAWQAALEAEEARIRAEVKRAYTDVLYAQELLHLRQEEVVLLERLRQAAQARLAAGLATELEVVRTEIQLADAQSRLEAAARDFVQARYELFRAIGLDPEAQRYDVVFPDTLVYIPVTISQEAVLARLAQLPEMRSQQAAVEAARFHLRQARTSILPKLQLDLYPQDYGDGYRFLGFQVGLSLPLGFLPSASGRVREARAQYEARRWEGRDLQLRLKQRAEAAWHGYDAARTIVERYARQVRDRSRELLARLEQGYRIGEVSLIELLDAQRLVLESEQRYYEALREYYHRLIELEPFLDQELTYTSR
ncbi:TolC family protein [Rhodothermus bifroesti]|nr:TolC family protein [Rhodothermus bifroesti]GBD02296.1 Outer membrane efflux protein BepC [bacterium HR18]